MLSCQRNRCCQRILHLRLISGNFVTSRSINFVEGRRHRQLHTSHLNLQSESSSLIFADQIERRKQRPYIDSNRIEEKRAKFEYNLRKSHLDDLPLAEMHPDQEIGRIFHLNDVQTKALMVHGRETLRAMMKGETVVNSQGQVIRPPGTIYRRKEKPSDEWTIRGQIRQIFGYFRFKEAANEEEEDGYGREGEEQNTPEQANKVVRIALITNLADFLIKVSAAYLTSSKSLLAEAVHSFLDLCNQGILYRGNLISVRKPDPDFPYGYGNMQYIYSMFAGFGILGAGCGLSIYNGVHGLYSNWWMGNPAELESLSLGMGLLSISFLLQFISFAKANREINKRSQKQGLSLKQYLQSSIADPSLRVVYLEDRASLCGVGFALTAIISTHFSGMPIFDSIGSICIGILLGHAAYKIIQTNAHHLVGRSLPKEKKKEIIDYMARDPIVRNMYDVKILYMGANDYRFKAEIEYNGRELTRIYLQDNCKREDLEREFAKIKDYEQLEEFLMSHGDKLIDKMGDEVDRLENNTRREFPEIRHMDLESH